MNNTECKFFEDEIYARYEDIWRQIKRATGETSAAYDIAQNVMLQIWTNIKRFQSYDDLDGAIKSTVYHHICNYYRGRARIAKRADIFDASRYNSMNFSVDDTLEEIVKHENGDEIVAALNKLDFKFYQTLELYYFQGYTLKAISEMLRISTSTVEYRKNKGLSLLRGYLTRKHNDFGAPDGIGRRMGPTLKTFTLLYMTDWSSAYETKVDRERD